jgi:hypothetical protein
VSSDIYKYTSDGQKKEVRINVLAQLRSILAQMQYELPLPYQLRPNNDLSITITKEGRVAQIFEIAMPNLDKYKGLINVYKQTNYKTCDG